jgi:hypothetical protein
VEHDQGLLGTWSDVPSPIIFDVNGDALQDVVICEDSDTLAVHLRNAPGSSPPLTGRIEVPSKGRLCGYWTPTYRVVDLDGDGTPNLVVSGEDNWWSLRYSRTAVGLPSLEWEAVDLPDRGTNTLLGGILPRTPPLLADLNSDGLVDLWTANVDAAIAWINTGTGKFLAQPLHRPRPAPAADSRFAHSRTTFLDDNGNGRTDVLELWRFSVGLDNTSLNYNVALLPSGDVSQLQAYSDESIEWTLEGSLPAPGGWRVAGDVDGDSNTDLFGQGFVY